MKKRLKILICLLSITLLAGFLTACGSDSKKTGEDSSHLNFGVYNYSDSLDPATNTNSSWCGVRYGITENLFKFNKEVQAEEYLAEKVEISDDYREWKIFIKDGVKFSNGNELTASAVKNSLERIFDETDPKKGGKGNSNPRDYLRYESITADDEEGFVKIICEKPTSNLAGILAYPYFAIIDTSVVDKEIVGTGPYKVAKENGRTSLELAKNEYYWKGEVPYETVSIVYIDDSSTKAMALKSGDIDIAENITTASDLETLANDKNFNVAIGPGVRTANSYLNFKGALKNDALRQAVMMALDKKTMCDITVAGMYTEGFSVLPSSLAYNYDKLKNPYDFNQEAAKKILDEAGIVDTDGDGFREIDGKNIELDSVTFTSRNLDEFAEAAVLQLAEIGIKVKLNIRDYDTAMALLNAGEFDLWTCNTLTVGVGDPQDYLGNWYSKNSMNYGYYSNHEYDGLYEKLLLELDSDKRIDLITQLQQILIDDAATIIYGYYNSTMTSNAEKVTGAEIATMDYYWLTSDIRPVEK